MINGNAGIYHKFVGRRQMQQQKVPNSRICHRHQLAVFNPELLTCCHARHFFKRVLCNSDLDWSFLKFGVCPRTLSMFQNMCCHWDMKNSKCSGNMNLISNKKSWWTVQLHSYSCWNVTGCTTSCSDAQGCQNKLTGSSSSRHPSGKLWGSSSHLLFPIHKQLLLIASQCSFCPPVTPRNFAAWDFHTIFLPWWLFQAPFQSALPWGLGTWIKGTSIP